MDIFDFDISPTGPAKKLDMGSCVFETGVKEGKVTNGGTNSEISWGGGLPFKNWTSDFDYAYESRKLYFWPSLLSEV